MTTIRISPPNEKQKLFLKARKKYIGFGGARGGGKSWGVQTKAKLLALHYPGIRILIVRRTYPELINNHIRQLRADLLGIAKYNDQQKIFTFPNGSTIQFAYCAKDQDLDRLQGTQFDIIFLDEATQLSEYQIKSISACLRGVNYFPKRIYFTMNPGGQGHQYIKRIFIDKQYRNGEEPEDYEFIQSLVTDNKALMKMNPDYKKQLEALPPKLRKAWLEGDWNIFEGQYFEDFRAEPDLQMAAEHGEEDPDPEELKKQRRWTHVISPFKPKQHWPIYRSHDWGSRRPFSMGYYTIDDDGVMYRIAEFYGVQHSGGEAIPNEGLKWPDNKVYAKIQQYEMEHPYLAGREIYGVADPAIWDADGGISHAEVAGKYGLYFQKGDNKRVPGWMQCHYRLMFDENGHPMFYCFDTCREFIRTIPTLQYDAHEDEDLDSDGEDHIADEWRYMCQARPITPMLPEMEYAPEWGSDPLDQFGRR